MLKYKERERVINRNPMLCDGTPRSETGYRVHVMLDGVFKYGTVDGMFVYIPSLLVVSPLLTTEIEAKSWQPEQVTIEL